jgi:hypothetical protein
MRHKMSTNLSLSFMSASQAAISTIAQSLPSTPMLEHCELLADVFSKRGGLHGGGKARMDGLDVALKFGSYVRARRPT